MLHLIVNYLKDGEMFDARNTITVLMHQDRNRFIASAKNFGGNCKTCKHAVPIDALQCALKRFKKVNPFAICEHFNNTKFEEYNAKN